MGVLVWFVSGSYRCPIGSFSICSNYVMNSHRGIKTLDGIIISRVSSSLRKHPIFIRLLIKLKLLRQRFKSDNYAFWTNPNTIILFHMSIQSPIQFYQFKYAFIKSPKTLIHLSIFLYMSFRPSKGEAQVQFIYISNQGRNYYNSHQVCIEAPPFKFINTRQGNFAQHPLISRNHNKAPANHILVNNSTPSHNNTTSGTKQSQVTGQGKQPRVNTRQQPSQHKATEPSHRART